MICGWHGGGSRSTPSSGCAVQPPMECRCRASRRLRKSSAWRPAPDSPPPTFARIARQPLACCTGTRTISWCSARRPPGAPLPHRRFPAKGKRWMDRAEFESHWISDRKDPEHPRGIAMTFGPGPDFPPPRGVIPPRDGGPDTAIRCGSSSGISANTGARWPKWQSPCSPRRFSS